ncbi:flagellar hook-associated protein FlgL [Steroidobacter sp. S1-65]|uniref:Flagellar hook-associated protein FlgL n=1 Tax=Steroidobacter gossypii TaxID=2805490 RepID=A0ABS1X506_9GAMM|nr:flagellar hook-associated protein FlgL [Steroidobacter gossypii]MBM0108311.1 flagellar hook-associated protein FlgL [Steroidobacter gossypii]
MRISTLGFSMGSVSAMIDQQSALAKLQNQVALGLRVSTPADDPIAYVHIQELQRAQSESEQFAKNSTLAKNRLSLEEQAFVDTSNVMTRVRELLVQAGNTGTLSDTDRRSIATELAARLDELQAIANRQDGNGEYLFSGYSTRTEPFSGGDGTPINYVGDQGARQLQLSTTQRVADSHNGFEVFVNIPEGNGTFSTAVNMSNTGSGIIDIGSVVDRPSWVPDDYTITFTSPTDYEITDSAAPPNVVGTGTYTSGSAITFNGVSVTITGAPAAGDTFEVNRSRSESIFDTIGEVVNILNTPAGDATANAKLTSTLRGSLQQLDQANDHFLSVRAQVGVRLATIDSVDASREATDIDLKSTLSDLRDLDYAQAIAQMNQQLVGLQAAQMSYTKIANLSLFNYLR